MNSELNSSPDADTLKLPVVGDLSLQSDSSVSFQTAKPNPTAQAKVLHLINGEHYSGAERVQDLLAMKLPTFGYDLGFACLKADKFPKQRTCQTTPLSEIDMLTRFDLRAVNRIAKIIRDEKYELIHAHTPRTALIGALVANKTGLPFVFHVHSPTSRDSTRRLINFVNQQVESWCLQRATAIVTVSESLKTHMLNMGCGYDEVFVVPNGVPCRRDLPTRLNPAGTWNLGTVALFRQRKGTEVLLEALAILRQKELDVRLTAVGGFETKSYEEQLRNRSKQLGLEDHVEWSGFTSDVTAEFDQMDLFVLPSLFGEGMPMVVLESMASGVPCVATKVEGVPEVIRHDVDGLLAEPEDANDLARQIETIISRPENWSRFRAHGLTRHADHFSDHAMARGLANVYDQVRSRQAT